MSNEALNLVWEHSTARPASARLVLVFLADRASGPLLECFPTIPQIAEHTGVHERQVKRDIQRLEQLGEIEVNRERRNNTYRITVPIGDAGAPNEAVPDWGCGRHQSGKRLGTPESPVVPTIGDTEGNVRWSPRPPNPKQPKERPAPERPPREADISSAPALGAQSRAASQGGAGALGASDTGTAELVRDVRRRADAAEVERMILRAHWRQAPPDRQTVPGSLAERLAGSKHATPMRVAYAIKAIDERCRKADREGKKINPLGLLVAALGAQENTPGEPWLVPPEFAQKWERNGLDRAKTQGLLDTISRRNAAAGSHRAVD